MKKIQTPFVVNNEGKSDLKFGSSILDYFIDYQSGGEVKSLLEALFNSIDAEAKVIKFSTKAYEVKLNGNIIQVDLTIEDDGIGFTEETFKRFHSIGFDGKPDMKKLIGFFNVGKGQIFRLGKQAWISEGAGAIVDTTQEFRSPNDFFLDINPDKYGLSHKGMKIIIQLQHTLLKDALIKYITDAIHEIRYKLHEEKIKVLIDEKEVQLIDDSEKALLKKAKHYCEFKAHFHRAGDILTFYNGQTLAKVYSTGEYGIGGYVIYDDKHKLSVERTSFVSDEKYKLAKESVESEIYNFLANSNILNDINRQGIQRAIVASQENYALMKDKKVFKDINGVAHSILELHKSKIHVIANTRKARNTWNDGTKSTEIWLDEAQVPSRVIQQLRWKNFRIASTSETIQAINFSESRKRVTKKYDYDTLYKLAYRHDDYGDKVYDNNDNPKVTNLGYCLAIINFFNEKGDFGCNSRQLILTNSEKFRASTDGTSSIQWNIEYANFKDKKNKSQYANVVEAARSIYFTICHEYAHNNETSEESEHGAEWSRQYVTNLQDNGGLLDDVVEYLRKTERSQHFDKYQQLKDFFNKYDA